MSGAVNVIGFEDANRRALAAITEAQWQATVVLHAETAGWFAYYIPDSMWRRAFKERGDGKQHGQKLGDRGFPDLHLVSPAGRVIYAELKTMTGKLSAHQLDWRDRLLAGGHDWRLWRPSDLDTVIEEFSRP